MGGRGEELSLLFVMVPRRGGSSSLSSHPPSSCLALQGFRVTSHASSSNKMPLTCA
jgi:hypothetical protein